MSKPRIFISSTIYDFYDLRSALKYWLEELGYQVLLSEYNDFEKNLDENALEVCLQTIGTVDYYILLVGSRVGARYDSTQNVSITMKEYRTAYQHMLSGKLKLITFVRKELWDIRHERRSLEEHLKNSYLQMKELSPEEIKHVVNYKSNFVNDAEAIFGFLSEIGKEEETEEATKSNRPFPKGNWIHPFSNFREIIEVLQVEFRIVHDLHKAALINNLKFELKSNLIHLLSKSDKEKIYRTRYWISTERKNFSGNVDNSTTFSSKQVGHIAAFLVLCTGYKFNTMFIDQALISGEFLEYSPEENTFYNSSIHESLLRLKQEIENYNGVSREDMVSELMNKLAKKANNSTVTIKNLDLLLPFALFDRLENIEHLSMALVSVLDGGPDILDRLKLNPTSPLPSQAEGIEKDKVTHEEVDEWIKGHFSSKS